MERKTRGIPLLALAILTAGVARAELPAVLEAAVRAELPREMAAAAPAGALAYEGPGGSFRVETGEMDGAEPAEAVLLISETGKPSRAVFVAESDSKAVRKAIKLPGGAPASIVAKFPVYAEGRSLAHVDGGASGAALFAWTGGKLDEIWNSGKPVPGETRWFEVDDLDDDGLQEVVAYERAALDVAADDEIGETASGSTTPDELRPTAVLRLQDGRWRNDKKLLETLR